MFKQLGLDKQLYAMHSYRHSFRLTAGSRKLSPAMLSQPMANCDWFISAAAVTVMCRSFAPWAVGWWKMSRLCRLRLRSGATSCTASLCSVKPLAVWTTSRCPCRPIANSHYLPRRWFPVCGCSMWLQGVLGVCLLTLTTCLDGVLLSVAVPCGFKVSLAFVCQLSLCASTTFYCLWLGCCCIGFD